MTTLAREAALWAVAPDDAIRMYRSGTSGLEPSEVERRLGEHGPNRLPQKAPRSAWAVAFAQLRGFLNLILIGAAVLAGVIGDVKDAAMIVVVVVFNTALGFFQEHRAERSLAALKAMVPLKARVLRGGRVQEAPAEDVVPGDVVLVEAGDRIPADGRLIETHSLEIDESALTGESVPVAKRAQDVVDVQTPIADRTNCAFMNTSATRGRGLLLVTATGKATQMGQVAGMLEEAVEPQTPLQRQLDHLGKRLAAIAVVVVLLISSFELWRGDSLVDILFEAIALFVAAVPEGLPAVVTVTLALGLHRMARSRAIMKRLAAVETLGSTTVICTDKTGTLTMNQMTARALWLHEARFSVTGEGYGSAGTIERLDEGRSVSGGEPIFVALALCNDSRIEAGKLIGDPTEGALLALANKAGLGVDELRVRAPRIAELPFESERKFMATAHAAGDHVDLFVKGAANVVLERCGAVLGEDGERALDGGLRAAVQQESEALAAQGLRVLAVASRKVPLATWGTTATRADEVLAYSTELTLLGLVGLMDPPRPEARQAIAQCKAAGITVKMITGDHRGTAAAIGAELGLHGDVIDGAELDVMDDDQLAARVEGIAVFSRAVPAHKLRIVRALKERGHIVAMTGDGVNDAPALKSADIGVAMGTGTEVAKQAATMVLTDDNFATIVGAVREGRTIYANILKFTRFQLSTNMGAILVVFLAPLLGLHTPLEPIHILFVAMFADGPPAIALGLDPPRAAIMSEAPRDPAARILTIRRLSVLVFYGAIMAAGTLGVLHIGGLDDAHGVTLAFTTFVLFQLFNLLNVRSEAGSAFNRQMFTNPHLWVAVALVVGLQVAVVHWAPLRGLFDTVPLALEEWGMAAAAAASLVVLDELRKLAVRAWGRWRLPNRSPVGRLHPSA